MRNKWPDSLCFSQDVSWHKTRYYGLQIPVETSIFQLVAQVIETVLPLIVSGNQM